MKNLEGGQCDKRRMDKPRVGEDEARGKENFYAMRRILFCNRKSLGKSEHTNDMS